MIRRQIVVHLCSMSRLESCFLISRILYPILPTCGRTSSSSFCSVCIVIWSMVFSKRWGVAETKDHGSTTQLSRP